ncbi:retrovirus-related pol polyprotein from transposon TNT 1-94 [Tanacetum coccineum]
MPVPIPDHLCLTRRTLHHGNNVFDCTVRDKKDRVDRTWDRVILSWGAGCSWLCGSHQNRVGNANLGQARQVKCYNCNGVGHITRNCTQPKHPQNSEYFKDKIRCDVQPGSRLELSHLGYNVFQVDDCDAYDSDVDEAPTAQTMFMANLSSADPVYDEASPSYDSDVLSEVQDHDHYQDVICDHHEEHEMHNDCRLYNNNASMVPNDAYVMIDNDVHESDVLSVSHTPWNTVVNNLLNAELATYKEQVELYERRARKDVIDVKNIFPLEIGNYREVHLYYLRHLKESVDTLREIVEESKVFNQQDKKHANTPRKKQVTFEDQIATSSSTTHKHVEPMHTQKSNVHVPPSTGVNSSTDASRSQPRSIFKKHRIPAMLMFTKIKECQHLLVLTNRNPSNIGDPVFQTLISLFSNAVFEIQGCETPTVVIKFLKQIQVGLNKTVRFIRTDNGTEFVNKTLYDYYESVGIFHQKTVPKDSTADALRSKTENQNSCRGSSDNANLSKAPMFLWLKLWLLPVTPKTDIPLIHTRHDKTPYELVHNKKPDLTFFRVFGALCYPTNDSENLGN